MTDRNELVARLAELDPVLEVEFDTMRCVEQDLYGATEAIEKALYLLRDQAAHIEQDAATIARLEATVAEVTSCRAYIIGANAGWEAAVEQGEATPAADAMLARAEAAEAKLARAVEGLDGLLEAITATTQYGDRSLDITGPTANLKWLLEAEEAARAIIAEIESEDRKGGA